MNKQFTIDVARGAQIADHLRDLAALRIRVFREWPYLYDGDEDYERHYLAGYAASDDAVVVLARAADQLIGAATAMPLLSHSSEVISPHRDAGFPLAEVFYFGESVLDPAWRGMGIGHAFFDHREEHGVARGRRVFSFCAVSRPADHPRRPANAHDLSGFWRGRGFSPHPTMRGTMRWKDLDDAPGTDSPKQMVFWVKDFR